MTGLKLLYLHGNNIASTKGTNHHYIRNTIIFFTGIGNLKNLQNLRSLTLHGNPVEQKQTYRRLVLHTLPNLQVSII